MFNIDRTKMERHAAQLLHPFLLLLPQTDSRSSLTEAPTATATEWSKKKKKFVWKKLKMMISKSMCCVGGIDRFQLGFYGLGSFLSVFVLFRYIYIYIYTCIKCLFIYFAFPSCCQIHRYFMDPQCTNIYEVWTNMLEKREK